MADAICEYKHARYERVYFAERKDAPGAWTVEAYDDDGGIEQAIFAGPDAQERAESYLRNQYGIGLEPR